MSAAIPFLPGRPAPSQGLLARYLPPLPEGVAEAWLSGRVEPGGWVLDPFGASPRLAVAAARAGYRVLVAANNPVARCLFEVAAVPPPEGELRAALAELAAAYKGDERIEPHLRALYTTECAQCGEPVEVEYFLWERGPAPGLHTPYARCYHCPACGDAGERPVSTADLQRAARFEAGGIHRARALERVAPLDDPDRAHAEEALSVYLPRAVYALFTLINRLDGLALSPTRRRLLDVILLNAFDGANTLWPHPTQRERPRQLTIPPRFRENNIWLALENGIERLAAQPRPGVTLSIWPQPPPPAGGVSLFEGRLKDLAAALPQIEFGAVLAALPRPNQAFWTLSALWAGWLWGREAVGPFKSVLRRRRYDWAWHTAALSAAFASLAAMLAPGVPFLGLISEAEPGFLTAALASAEGAGFDLEGLALRAPAGQLQAVWRKPQAGVAAEGAREQKPPSAQPRSLAARAALDFLRERGQPAPYLPLQAAALSALAEAHAFPWGSPDARREPADVFAQVQAWLKETFTSRSGFLRYEGSESSLEVGQWWLATRAANGSPARAPLADRVEMACVRMLQKNPGCTLAEIDAALCQAFPGLHTPDSELIQLCLDSYGEPVEATGQPGRPGWRLRPEDRPSARRKDLEEARQMIRQLGERLGFQVAIPGAPADEGAAGTATPSLWLEPGAPATYAGARYIIFILASAAFGEIVLRGDVPAEKALILLPGGRANLAAYKLRCNPHLRQEIDKGWRFVKYRHLRRLLEDRMLSPENLDEQLALDPLAYSATQMRLL